MEERVRKKLIKSRSRFFLCVFDFQDVSVQESCGKRKRNVKPTL